MTTSRRTISRTRFFVIGSALFLSAILYYGSLLIDINGFHLGIEAITSQPYYGADDIVNSANGWSHSDQRNVYRPGTIGKGLFDQHLNMLMDADSAYTPSTMDVARLEQEMFALSRDWLADEGDNADMCRDWRPEMQVGDGDRLWSQCRRARIWKQADDWDWWGETRAEEDNRERNRRFLDRLKRCAANNTFPISSLPIYPTSFTSGRSESDSSDPQECTQTTFKVLLGDWGDFSQAFGPSGGVEHGEAIWMRSNINALIEMGYTVLAVKYYQSLIAIHNAMPDVITHIWMDTNQILACQEDARCRDWSTFGPTSDRYDVQFDSSASVMADNQGQPIKGPKWFWTREDLDSLPVKSRGTIPLWKMFSVNYWGARPGNWDGCLPHSEFYFNPLSQAMSLVPFDYPNHTAIQFSIEHECIAQPAISYTEKKDEVFILAKLTKYFHESRIPSTFWPESKALTGLQFLTVASDQPHKEGDERYPMPEGLSVLGEVSKEEFRRIARESKVMLGLGHPPISPSVYESLCAGTPVVLPYHKGAFQTDGWKLVDQDYSQHGPAQLLGPPYVYSWDSNNNTDMIEKVRIAARNPIDRYIPVEMRAATQFENLDAIMRFDWRAYGQAANMSGQSQLDAPERIKAISECYELERWNGYWE